MEMLKIENLSKTFGENTNKVEALKNITFSVNKGEFISIIGTSGSGKSTLLHLISGIDKPTSGKISIQDEDISKYNMNQLTVFRRRHIGVIYQFYNLVPILTVRENIELPIRLDSRIIEEKKIKYIIDLLNLTGKENYLPAQLSGGEQQRVAIGRAIINNPSIILADEPTGNLDTKNSDEIMEYLKYSNKKYNQTIIMVTHNEKIALKSDRIIKIQDGSILFDKRNSWEKKIWKEL